MSEERSNKQFADEMKQCGYDVGSSDLSRTELLVVGVAKAMWKSQQNRIEETEARITRFHSALESL
jgi:hypothetical protein